MKGEEGWGGEGAVRSTVLMRGEGGSQIHRLNAEEERASLVSRPDARGEGGNQISPHG